MKKKNILSVTKKYMALLMTAVIFTAGCGDTGADREPEASAISTSSEPVIYEPETEEGGEYIIKDVDFSLSQAYKNGEYNNTDEIVFYEIFVGSFSDSDGDGTGDLRGIINRFDYLNDGNPESGKSLGVEGIWLTPIFKSPSYHKYDVTNYYEIDPEFGTMDDLKELVELCHERGVKIILDMVINHTSSDNKWFQEFTKARRSGDTESEYYDFYTAETTNSMGGRTFYKIKDTEFYYEGNFWSEMPELNFDNPKVRETVIDVADYYLTDIDVDGFRFDAAKYIYYNEHDKNVEFWNWYLDEVNKIKPDVYTVAEVWDSDSLTNKYEEAINCFDFTMAQSGGLIAETAMQGNVNRYTAYVEAYIDTVTTINENAMIIPFIANHDMDRSAGFLNAISGNAKMGANLYLLGPGSPYIYYGEEVGLKGSRGGSNTDANRRLAMRWGDEDKVRDPEGADYGDKKQTNPTVTEQLDAEDSIYTHYKKLLMLRKANPEIYLGDYRALNIDGSNVGGFVSTYNDVSVCVIHNTTDKTQTISLAGSGIDEKLINQMNLTAAIGSGISEEVGASYENGTLTISAQTSVILR